MITTARDLRFHAKGILETTMRGEEVIVTYRGKPAAKIIPFTGKSKSSRKKLLTNCSVCGKITKMLLM